MRMTKLLVAVAVALVLLVPAVQAQTRPEVGLRLGGTVGQLRGERNIFPKKATDSRLGFTVGVYASQPLAGGFSLQPELLYVQKGGKFDQAVAGMGTVESDYKLQFIELPLLLSYAVPMRSRWTTSLSAGPYAAYGIARDLSFDADEGEVDGVMDAEDVFERWDYGITAGADIGYRFVRRSATIGVRYDFGLANIFQDEASIDVDGEDVTTDLTAHTREFSVILGVRLF